VPIRFWILLFLVVLLPITSLKRSNQVRFYDLAYSRHAS
jgi:hypothetical protein